MDGYATVQTAGFVEGVPTAAAINAGVKTLAVNNAGVISSVDSTDSSAEVILPSAVGSLNATLLLGK